MVGVRLGFAYLDAPILAIGQSLSLHTLSTRRSVHDVLFLFKLLNNLVDAPEVLALISFRCPTAQTRSRELFVRKHVDTHYRANFFSNRVHNLATRKILGYLRVPMAEQSKARHTLQPARPGPLHTLRPLRPARPGPLRTSPPTATSPARTTPHSPPTATRPARLGLSGFGWLLGQLWRCRVGRAGPQ
ncbi:hypothetical protein J6590_033594 [Homalodisca vitripennis]|nr:hypothetical protein J6590_033594 [Homalodisca vitripennis]